MVEIISKRDGPRREDIQVKRLIEQNRSTIVRLADQISGGGYSASKETATGAEGGRPDHPCRRQCLDCRGSQAEHTA